VKIITVNLPESYLKTIAEMVGETGLYPSRSELIRVALKEFLQREIEAAQQFTQLAEEQSSCKNEPAIDQSLFVRVPVAHTENIEDMEYKTYRIVKK
jgi:antitoxin ParD1/3/4